MRSALHVREPLVDKLSCDHEGLLVGKRYVLVRTDCGESGLETAVADGGCDYHVDVVGGDAVLQRLRSGGCPDAEWCEGVAQTGQKRFVADDGETGTELFGKGYEIVDASACGKDCGAVSFGVSSYYVECLAPYRAGGAKHGKSFLIGHGKCIIFYAKVHKILR